MLTKIFTSIPPKHLLASGPRFHFQVLKIDCIGGRMAQYDEEERKAQQRDTDKRKQMEGYLEMKAP